MLEAKKSVTAHVWTSPYNFSTSQEMRKVKQVREHLTLIITIIITRPNQIASILQLSEQR